MPSNYPGISHVFGNHFGSMVVRSHTHHSGSIVVVILIQCCCFAATSLISPRITNNTTKLTPYISPLQKIFSLREHPRGAHLLQHFIYT
ncbi:hypothetical protein Y032_0008g305 [Ancylostoma ceylanicum]|uniref:Uncharacterized protein n=1 Tax=Ancylostoma ceylanicum TaxID=53326 RepID=A0A016VKE8_9BILA|nr:hypothetical protein Y032_0008g305 [Ancylostoma ceylanicum]